jgi:putative ABC transport system substrate-binding protein
MLSRRSLLQSTACLSFATAASAQNRPPRIGWLTAQTPTSLAPYVAAFRSGLAAVGIVEGSTIEIDFRFGNDDASRVPDLARELVASQVRLIVAQGTAVPILRGLKLPVPVIYAVSSDPVVAGYAETLARPSGNMTGVTFMAAELNGKRLELLRDMIPGFRRVALIGTPEHPGVHLERNYAAGVAERMGVRLDYFPTATREELAAALDRVRQDPPQAVSILGDGFALANRTTIIGAATALRLPVISAWRVFAEAGAVCSYGPALEASYRRLVYFVDRVLKGAAPADLPVEQPTQFETVLNLNAARALGIAVPPSVMAQADFVIDS